MRTQTLLIALAASPASVTLAQCGDVYAGTWRNPPFGYDVYHNGVPFQFTPGSFDAPDQTPIAFDRAGNLFHAQTIDAQGTVRIFRNNTPVHTYSARGGPSWVYSGLALAVEPDGTFHTAFYTAPNTVTVFRNGNTVEATFAATGFQGSPVGLAWDAEDGVLYASIRTASNEVKIFTAAGATVATLAAAGVPLAAWGGDLYWAHAVSGSTVDIYREGALLTTITGSFSAGSRFPLAVDGEGNPFILVGSGGDFVVVDQTGAVLHTLPNTAGGGGTGLAVFAPAPCSCYPDCDTSTGVGVLDIFDFLCFQNRYDTGSAYACDCDGSTGPGVCDIFDFLCFQNAYDAGCR